MSADPAAPPQCLRDRDGAADRRRIVVSTPAGGMLWFGGWLFTIGFADLGFWKAVLALVIWPYVLGDLAR